MITRRLEIVNSICQKIGIRPRYKPDSQHLSKMELSQLNSWITTMITVQQRHRDEVSNQALRDAILGPPKQ